MKHLNKTDNLEELVKEGTHLVDFHALWCGPCKMLGTVLEKLDDEIDIIKIDIDEHEDIAREFGIMSVPTLIFYKDGKVVKQILGFHSKDEIQSIIDTL